METRRQRLRRLDTVYADNPVCFITACTADRKRILADASIHTTFVDFGKKGTERGIFVGRYVLMPDHLHLFVQFSFTSEEHAPVAAICDRRPAYLSTWIKSLKNTLSKSMRENGNPSPHWQKGFFDHILRSGESYLEKWQYVLDNPVRAGLVKNWQDWPHQGEIHPLQP